MPFKNRIRLPFYLSKAQFPFEKEAIRLADGTTRVLNTVIQKKYTGQTDNIPEGWHEKLIIALSHDDVRVESDRYMGDVALDTYNIDWQDFLDFPLAKSEFQVEVTPYDMTNANCESCDEYTQLSLEDDVIYGDLSDGDVTDVQVLANDSICCSPFTAEILSFNTSYLDDATIDQNTGLVTVTVKNPVQSITDAVLVTYRVTCPNGQYDDATVTGTISGSVESCQPATNLSADIIGETTADMMWTASASAVDEYGWALYLTSNLGTPVQTGNTTGTTVSLTGLIPGTSYTFVVTTDCLYSETDSEAVDVEFTTVNTSSSCGSFTMTNDNYPSPATVAASYMDCNGDIQHVFVSTTLTRCMLMDENTDPVYLVMHAGGSYAYNGLCVDSVLISAVIAGTSLGVCSGSPSTYYIASPNTDVAPGVVVYLDPELSILAGTGYIADDGGTVYIINSGLVGSATGETC